MKPLTLITHHYNGHERVIDLLDHFTKFSSKVTSNIKITVVDDFSDHASQLPRYPLEITQYRITTDIAWNQPGARNLGVFLCDTPWALLFDVDQRPSEEGIAYILEHLNRLEPDTIYSFLVKNYFDANDNCPLDIHPNTLLVPVANFKVFGMYDEDFAGNYAHEDLYLAVMWEARGGKRKVLGKTPLFVDIGHKTSTLERNIEPNKTMAHQKIINGCQRPKSFLRFDWATVETHE